MSGITDEDIAQSTDVMLQMMAGMDRIQACSFACLMSASRDQLPAAVQAMASVTQLAGIIGGALFLHLERLDAMREGAH